jgi:drug/metabolite transporter (DMT)-like permease
MAFGDSEPVVAGRPVAAPPAARPPLSARGAGVLMAVVVAVLGVNWPILKLGLRGVDPLWFASLRILLTAVGYTGLLAAQGRLAWPRRPDLSVLFVVGVFQMGVMVGLMTYGLKHVDAGRSVILVYTTSLWVVPGAVLFLGERISRWQIIGLLSGCVGVVVLFNPFTFAWTDRAALLGNASLIVAALSWAVALLWIRGHRWRLGPLQLLPWQSLVGGLLLVPFAAWQEGYPPTMPVNPRLVLVLLYNVVPAGCFALWGLMAAGRVLPAITLSIGQLATPVIGVASAALILGEVPTPDRLAGLACIVAGVALATIAPRRLPA